MFGVLLVSLSTFVSEIGNAIGKKEVMEHKESMLGMGFLNMLWATVFMVVIVFALPAGALPFGISNEYVFDMRSLPTFILRVILEIILIHMILKGATIATRTTFTFLRVSTIPLLLIIDLLLGYQVSLYEIIGIGIIVLTTLYLVSSSTIKREGMWYVLGSAILAVGTITIYKYHITNYNSVAGEQLTMLLIMLTYLFFATVYSTRKNPLRHLERPLVLLQSLSLGLGSIIASFAFLYAASSVITTAKRTSAILWSIISGKILFNEQKFVLKMHAFLVLVGGLYLLT